MTGPTSDDTLVIPAAEPGGRRRRGLLVGLAVGLLLVLAYVGAAFALSGRIASGTSVAGVDVGGLSRDAAAERLEQAVAARGAAALPVTAGGRTGELPASALALDAGEEADALTGFTLAPAALVDRVRGGGTQRPAGDRDAVVAAVEAARPALDLPAVDAGVRFEGTRPVVVPATAGASVDADAAADAVLESWLAAPGPVELPVVEQPARVDDAAAQALAEGAAATAVSAPVVVRAGDVQVSLPPEQVAPALRVTSADGRLALAVDGAVLRAAAVKAEPGLEAPARDADVVLRDGRPAVVPAVVGRRVDPGALGTAAGTAVTGTSASARVAAVEPVVAQPDLTTAEATALGVRERISTFSTDTTADAGRTENLRMAARTVDGTLVLPGETFSLNGVLGQRTPEKGYNQAPAISGGRLVLDYGGGVSQMATTIFNNVFFAGLEDVYHKPHSFYISRYPEGREATVNWPDVDLKWRNDSPHGVLIQAGVSGGEVTVSFWGTKRYDVDAVKGERRNLREPETVYDDDGTCVSQSASTGFDVTVTRIFRQGGREVRRERFDTTYNAEDRVVCGPRP